MASIPTINFVQGDDMPTVTLRIRDKNTPKDGAVLDATDSSTWKPVNLTGAQITVDVREKGGYITDTFGAAIIDAADGRVYLSLPEDPVFLQTAGNYEAEITVKFPNDAQQTVYDLLPMKVRERFSKGA